MNESRRWGDAPREMRALATEVAGKMRTTGTRVGIVIDSDERIEGNGRLGPDECFVLEMTGLGPGDGRVDLMFGFSLRAAGIVDVAGKFGGLRAILNAQRGKAARREAGPHIDRMQQIIVKEMTDWVDPPKADEGRYYPAPVQLPLEAARA